MALEGQLRDFSATEILQLVASQRKTGCLELENGTHRMAVHVLDGRIVSTRGGESLADDPLYRFLRRVRRLSEEQLKGIVSLHAESRRDLEDLIVQGRYLEPEELGTLMERQVLSDLAELIEWPDGRYRFDADRRWPHPVIVRLSIEASLIEAARRADERKRFQELFRDGRQIVSVRDLPDPEEEIADEESELFGIIDGQHTVAEVIAEAPLTDYEASEALQRMIEAGWVEFLGRREPEAGTAPTETAARARVATPARPMGPPLVREAVVGILSLAALGALWVLAQSMAPAQRHPAPDSPFAAAEIRDVRYALELYQREHDRYPQRLEELVKEQWLSPRQLVVNGSRLHYRLDPARQSYRLDLPPAP